MREWRSGGRFPDFLYFFAFFVFFARVPALCANSAQPLALDAKKKGLGSSPARLVFRPAMQIISAIFPSSLIKAHCGKLVAILCDLLQRNINRPTTLANSARMLSPGACGLLGGDGLGLNNRT